jgi:hypothetical protein
MNEDSTQTEIYLLTDWDRDTWTRIYVKILKNATFSYTFNKADVKEGKPFTHVLKDVKHGSIKKVVT